MSSTEDSFQKIYNRLIPVVIVIPILFLILFIVVSMVQLQEINKRIEEGQSQTIKELLNKFSAAGTIREDQLQFLTLAVLEEESLAERYRQGHYSLVSRTFKQYLGFFTGIILILVGSVFILLKLKEKVNLAADQSNSWKITLVTSSPGVAFAVVGAILISIASTSKDVISVRDTGLYLTREYLVAPFFTGSKPAVGNSESDMAGYLHDQSTKSDSSGVPIVHPPINSE